VERAASASSFAPQAAGSLAAQYFLEENPMRKLQIILAAACLASPMPLLAQSGSDQIIGRENDDEGENPRLGLLGLLGLAGLLGLYRREPDIHVDARRDKSGETISSGSTARP
jgi:MYXO-CTERM domain-containing protein